MSFFGALFAGVTFLAKGISKGQDIAEDHKLRDDARSQGKKTYYDHKGILHDETGRAITYHTDSATGHKLIQDAYTLQTIRNLTLEENCKEIQNEIEKAKKEGNEYYVWCKHGKIFQRLGRKEAEELLRKYSWGKDSRIRKWEKDFCGRETNKRSYSLNNIDFHGVTGFYTDIYMKEKDLDMYIMEDYNELKVYTNLKTGLVVDIEKETKRKLKELGINEEVFVQKINEKKIEWSKKYFDKIPMCTNF